ncbi:MAG TPA: hypothetical protein ENN38_05400 [Actinobacteria bacterium]|nr:hypothetical protein [Actinomycetota bacterium]
MKFKASTAIAVLVIVLLIAGVAYAVTNKSAKANHKGKGQHEMVSSKSSHEDCGGNCSKSDSHKKGKGSACSDKKETHSKKSDAGDREEYEHVFVNLQGKTTEVNLAEGNSIKIEAEDGNVYEVEVGPRWFWEEKGINISEDNELLVKAVKNPQDEASSYGAVAIKNISTGKTATLRTPEGEPLWKGGKNSH